MSGFAPGSDLPGTRAEAVENGRGALDVADNPDFLWADEWE